MREFNFVDRIANKIAERLLDNVNFKKACEAMFAVPKYKEEPRKRYRIYSTFMSEEVTEQELEDIIKQIKNEFVSYIRIGNKLIHKEKIEADGEVKWEEIKESRDQDE